MLAWPKAGETFLTLHSVWTNISPTAMCQQSALHRTRLSEEPTEEVAAKLGSHVSEEGRVKRAGRGLTHKSAAKPFFAPLKKVCMIPLNS